MCRCVRQAVGEKGLSARRRFWCGELPSKSSPRLRDREDLSISRRGRRDRREKAGHLCDLCGLCANLIQSRLRGHVSFRSFAVIAARSTANDRYGVVSGHRSPLLFRGGAARLGPATPGLVAAGWRSEERRVGKAWVSTCRYRGEANHSKK